MRLNWSFVPAKRAMMLALTDPEKACALEPANKVVLADIQKRNPDLEAKAALDRNEFLLLVNNWYFACNPGLDYGQPSIRCGDATTSIRMPNSVPYRTFLIGQDQWEAENSPVDEVATHKIVTELNSKCEQAIHSAAKLYVEKFNLAVLSRADRRPGFACWKTHP